MAKRPSRKRPARAATAVARPARRGPKVPGESETSPASPRAQTPPDGFGKYVYCIVRSDVPLKFGLSAIAGHVGDVHTVKYRDLAAVVSDVPLVALDSTRENVLAHEQVNETVMREHTVIPMSFGTVFKTADDIVELLRSAYQAFGDVLGKIENKLEYGLKVLWDREVAMGDLEEGIEDIRRLKKEIALQKGSTYFARMEYGRLVSAGLDHAAEQYAAGILERLRDVAVSVRVNKPIGEQMILNAAFLVSRDRETAFDQRVRRVAAQFSKLTFKYTGPWPPYNFVNIRLKLERA